MRGFGLEPATATWFIVNPAHIEIARNHLMMAECAASAWTSRSRALFDSARPLFRRQPACLLYGDARDLVHARRRLGRPATPPRPTPPVGMNLTDWMPLGANARACRKLQNEVQMLWHRTRPTSSAKRAA